MICKKILACLLSICCCVTAFAQDEKPKVTAPAKSTAEMQQTDSAAPATEDDEDSTIEKGSFMIGFNTITRLKRDHVDYDFENIMAGLKAAHEGRDSGMTEEEQRSVLGAYQNLVRSRMKARQEALAAKNGEEGEKAMAEFAKQEGAKELEDGVMYVVLKDGDGEVPEAPDRVKVHYHGTYVDGEVFDSSLEKDPIINGAMQFVPGFAKAIQTMKVGSKWKLIVRGDKAYGMRPRPPMEVNKTLMFEVELLEIMPVE